VETLTFLFTDIEGSTRLLGDLGPDRYAALLGTHHAVVRAALGAHGGEEIGDPQGDGFFAAFTTPSQAVAASIAIQCALEAEQWPDGRRVRVRMGLHTGEARRALSGLVGFDVHRAARVAAVAHGGQILLSAATVALVGERLPEGVTLRDLGAHRLKDLGKPERLFQLEVPGLEASFPPLRSLDNPSFEHNLPFQLSNFVGRRAEVAALVELVRSSRLVSLVGAGGSGKTRLALQVGAELLGTSHDGVFLVELAPLGGADQVAATIAEVLHVLPGAGRPVLESLFEALSPQEVLLLLDNCEHLLEECARVAGAVLRSCPRVRLLVTSREPLGISGETIYRVPSLTLPADGEDPASSDAVALFLDRVRTQGIALTLDEASRPLVVSVCQRLDGLPLALELAATRLRSLSLEDLHHRLDQRFRLLTGGSRGALPRQQTLRATVEWSYSLLSDTERSLLRRLAVYVDGFDLDAAEAICPLGDLDALEVADLLGSLVDKSLVVAEPVAGRLRYRMTETIRQFAAERLVEEGEDRALALADAHSRYFLELVEQAAAQLTGPEQGRVLDRFDTEHANIVRALERAASDPARTVEVLRFAGHFQRYWIVRGRVETLDLVLSVLDRDGADRDLVTYGWALLSAVPALVFAGRTAAAREEERTVRALEVAAKSGEGSLLAYASAVRASMLLLHGEIDAARALALDAATGARALRDDRSLSAALYVVRATAAPQDWGLLLAEHLECAERLGDPFEVAHVCHTAADVAMRAGDLVAARANLVRYDECQRAIGVRSDYGATNWAWLLRSEGDLAAAEAKLDEALRFSRRSGQRGLFFGYELTALACLAGDRGDWERSAVLHGAAGTHLPPSSSVMDLLEFTFREESMVAGRAALGEAAFDAAFARGAKLDLAGTYALALGE